MTPGQLPGGTNATGAGTLIDGAPAEASTPPHRTEDAARAPAAEAAPFPNAVDRALGIKRVGDTVAVTLGDYAPDSLAFLFAWDPVADKEVYVRSGRRSELEAQAGTGNREGRDYFVLPRNPTEKKTLFARVDEGGSLAPSSTFGSPADPHPSSVGAAPAAGGTEHTMEVFVVVPGNRQPRQPFRVEKNLDGRHWTSQAEAEGALAVFEHEHADIAGAMRVRPARLRFSL